MPEDLSLSIALLAMRLLAGILFFFQGFDKVFTLKTEGVMRAFADVLAQKNVPLPLAKTGVAVSSWIEMGGGLLLAIGLFREPVLYLLTADLLLVAVAFSFMKPMWDMGYFFPRFILLMVLLILPAEWDCFSAAHLF